MAHSFARRTAVYRQQARVLVLCEDTKSGKTYLEEAAGHFRANAKVKVSHCGKTNPLGIVDEAVRQKKDYDHVYCVIDRDTHAGFAEALQSAAKHAAKITVIASYPCYEFWLYLHFKHTRKTYVAAGGRSAAECLVKELSQCDGMQDYDKDGSKGLFARLLPRLPEARVRSQQILAAAQAENLLNPSTELHVLIAKFESLAQLQPAK